MRSELEITQDHLDPEQFYRTNDMAAATYLKLKGHPTQAMRWDGQTCYWVFRVTDALLEDVEVFSEGGAIVEPREYNRMFSQTKREFYDAKAAIGRKGR